MSQTSKSLKKIASSEAYQALEAAIKKGNPEAIFNAYTQVSGLLEEAQKEILERIQRLSRRNKNLDWQRCQAAFAARSETILPQWHWVNAQLRKQKVMEGKVFGFGNKGDPLVKTPEGRVVVIKGATLKEAEETTFKVVAEGEKLDFGRVFELTPDTFYFVLTEETRERIRNTLNSLRERIDGNLLGTGENQLTELSQLLRELDEIRELAAKLRDEEKERILNRILAYRKRLLRAFIPKLVFQSLSEWEEKEIESLCHSDRRQLVSALSAPGLFRYPAHEALKTELLDGERPKGYSEILDKLEKKLDSMDSALQLMDFQTKIEEVYPAAKRYLGRIDRFFAGLSERARQVAISLGEDKVYAGHQIQSAIAEAFSIEMVCRELRQVFRSAREFFTLREALGELRTRLGNTEVKLTEADLESYLSRMVTVTFGDKS